MRLYFFWRIAPLSESSGIEDWMKSLRAAAEIRNQDRAVTVHVLAPVTPPVKVVSAISAQGCGSRQGC